MSVETILFLGNDLNATARIASAAESVGATLQKATPGSLARRLEELRPDVLILDLDNEGRIVLDDLDGLRARGALPETVLGFFSHVDKEAAEAARAAGVRPVPRGRFFTSATDLLSGN